MRTATVDLRGAHGARLRADVMGEPGAPPVLLFAGGGQTRHSWKTTGQLLGERGWCAYLVDQRGHGESEWPEERYTFDAVAGDVRALAHAVGAPALVGASLGGISALLAVGESDVPIASALVLVDIAPRIES